MGPVYSVFYYKQKTAYEVRISEWSSDVCSSDRVASVAIRPYSCNHKPICPHKFRCAGSRAYVWSHRRSQSNARDCRAAISGIRLRSRSEEHTSELQSLMRISYAVFCLKKKKKKIKNIQKTIRHAYTKPD